MDLHENITVNETYVVNGTTYSRQASKTLTKKIKITAKDLPDVVTEATHMIWWVFVLKWSVYGLIWTQALELSLIYMHNQDVLPEDYYNKILFVR